LGVSGSNCDEPQITQLLILSLDDGILLASRRSHGLDEDRFTDAQFESLVGRRDLAESVTSRVRTRTEPRGGGGSNLVDGEIDAGEKIVRRELQDRPEHVGEESNDLCSCRVLLDLYKRARQPQIGDSVI
jgi:hypothetical protein